MSAIGHLIQPVVVSAAPRCVQHGATTPKWRTVSFPAAVDGSMTLWVGEDNDQWLFEPVPVDEYGNGSVTFGTCCLWKATVRFKFGGLAYYTGRVFINEVLVGEFYDQLVIDTEIDIAVDLSALGLMGRACGNVWRIEGEIYEGTSSFIIIEIINVLFGPPDSLDTLTFNTPANSQFQPLI